MAEWFQTFDDAGELDRARAGTRRLVVAFAIASGGLVAGALLASAVWHADAGLVALLSGGVLSAIAFFVLARLTRESQRMWRIEISARLAVGHDTAGRRVVLPWTHVDRVDVTSEGLAVIGTDTQGLPVRLWASATMPTFTSLAHRTAEVADAHGRQVCVEGCPVDDIDLVALLPTLCESGTAAA